MEMRKSLGLVGEKYKAASMGKLNAAGAGARRGNAEGRAHVGERGALGDLQPGVCMVL